MKNLLAHPATRIAVLVLAAVVLIAAVLVVLNRDEEGDDGEVAPLVEIPEDATPEERARAHLDTAEDGTHQGRLITIDATTVTFRLVRVLTGAEAAEAARAAGALQEGQSLPGDTYVQDLGETRTLPLAEDATIQIQQCADACQEVATTVDALVSGEAQPNGGATPVFTYTVSGGTVVSLTEMIVP